MNDLIHTVRDNWGTVQELFAWIGVVASCIGGLLTFLGLKTRLKEKLQARGVRRQAGGTAASACERERSAFYASAYRALCIEQALAEPFFHGRTVQQVCGALDLDLPFGPTGAGRWPRWAA